MGNVNARDGNGSPTAAEEEGGGGSVQEDMAAPDGVRVGHGGYHEQGVSSEVMGLSPPTSPRATQSPLIFTPQVSFLFTFLPHAKDFFFFLVNEFLY